MWIYWTVSKFHSSTDAKFSLVYIRYKDKIRHQFLCSSVHELLLSLKLTLYGRRWNYADALIHWYLCVLWLPVTSLLCEVALLVPIFSYLIISLQYWRRISLLSGKYKDTSSKLLLTVFFISFPVKYFLSAVFWWIQSFFMSNRFDSKWVITCKPKHLPSFVFVVCGTSIFV